MSKTFIAFVATLFLCSASTVRADVFDGLDVGTGSGGVAGRVSSRDSEGETHKFRIGGLPFVAMLNRDLASQWTGSLQAQVLLDAVNRQMIRQGFSGTLAYHFLGGSRRIATASDVAKELATNRYNVSILVRGGVFSYAATERNDPKSRLSGSVWEMASGLEYRKTVSEKSAFGASAISTVVTLPASVDRLSARVVEVMAFWRVYL